MKDGGIIKSVSIAGSVAIVITMLVTDGTTATVAAGALLAGLSGLGGYAWSEAKKSA